MRSSILTLALASCLYVGCAPQSGAKTEATPSSTTGGEAATKSPAGPTPIATQELPYQAGTTKLVGFLAYPAGLKDKAPGVLIVHEWWGLNEYARSRAKQLAELGYVALAVDMYGDGKSSEHPDDAKKMMMQIMQDPAESRLRFEAGLSALKGDPRIDANRVAAIGYCMGGAIVLHAARRGEALDAVASFHGNYGTQTPMPKGAFSGKIFVAHGAADSFTPPGQLAALKSELDAAGARYEVVEYPGAKHGFTNPKATEAGQKNGIDLAYDASADEKSWSKLQEVLTEAFAQP